MESVRLWHGRPEHVSFGALAMPRGFEVDFDVQMTFKWKKMNKKEMKIIQKLRFGMNFS